MIFAPRKKVSLQSNFEPVIGALDLADQSFHLLRRRYAELTIYYIGAVPFVLALTYFWSEMRRYGNAAQRTEEWSLVLTGLFVWMKLWQVIYADRLSASIRGEPASKWSILRLGKVVLSQAILQPTGFIVLPVAILLTFPLGWVYAFYQNLTVLDDGEKPLRELVARARKHAGHWQMQNLILMWFMSPILLVTTLVLYLGIVPLVSPFFTELGRAFLGLLLALAAILCVLLSPLGVILAVNVTISLILLPQLAKALLGVDLWVVRLPAFWTSTMFAATIGSIVYLLMDPFMKAAYVLRCFYTESAKTGEDLRVQFRKIVSASKTALVILVFCCLFLLQSDVSALPQQAPADAALLDVSTTAIAPQELQQALDEVFRRQEFFWRFPQESLEPLLNEDNTIFAWIRNFRDRLTEWVRSIVRGFQRFLDRIRKWLDGFLPTGNREGPVSETGKWVRVVLIILAVACASACLLLLYLTRRKRSRKTSAEIHPILALDLEDEQVQANDLPEEEWLRIAQQCINRGEYRSALRALFLFLLAYLAREGIVALAIHKTNRDYLREIERRAQRYPALKVVFERCVLVFERVWYGGHLATSTLVNEFYSWVLKAKIHETGE